LLIPQCSIANLTCRETSIAKVRNSKFLHLMVPGFFGSYQYDPSRVTHDPKWFLVTEI